MMNSDSKVDIKDTTSIRWDCEVPEDLSSRYIQDGKNFYINRQNRSIYSMLIQRPLVVKNALEITATDRVTSGAASFTI